MRGTHPKRVDFSTPVSTSHNLIVPSRAPVINIGFFCLSPPSLLSMSLSSISAVSVCKKDFGSTCSVLGRSLKLFGSNPGGADEICGDKGPVCRDATDVGGDRDAGRNAEVEVTGLRGLEDR